MDLEFKMPDLATTDSEIRVIRWLVAPGDAVKRGQALLEVETDKATMEVESIAGGVLKSANVRPGDAVAAGHLIAVITTQGGSPPSIPLPGAKADPRPTPSAAASTSAPAKAAGGMFARNRAMTPKPTESGGSIPLSMTRRTAARRMQESKQTIPHFYLQASADAEGMIRLRTAATPVKLAWDALVACAVGRALKRWPGIAAHYEADQLKLSANHDVGIAVDHDGELYIAVVQNPSARTPEEVSAELRERAQGIRAGDPESRRLRPVAITLSNLGSTRVEAFSAIINPGEAAILALGRVAAVAVVERDGTIAAKQRMTLTLSVDHRVANGKYAADFLSDVVREIESF